MRTPITNQNADNHHAGVMTGAAKRVSVIISWSPITIVTNAIEARANALSDADARVARRTAVQNRLGSTFTSLTAVKSP